MELDKVTTLVKVEVELAALVFNKLAGTGKFVSGNVVNLLLLVIGVRDVDGVDKTLDWLIMEEFVVLDKNELEKDVWSKALLELETGSEELPIFEKLDVNVLEKDI